MPVVTCVALLQTGERVGEACNTPVEIDEARQGDWRNHWCGRHRRLPERRGPLGENQCVGNHNGGWCENRSMPDHHVCAEHHVWGVRRRAARDEQVRGEAALAARIAAAALGNETWDRGMELLTTDETLQPLTRARMVRRYLDEVVPQNWNRRRRRVIDRFNNWLMGGRFGQRPNTVLPEPEVEAPQVLPHLEELRRRAREAQAAFEEIGGHWIDPRIVANVPPPNVAEGRHQPRLHGLGRLAEDRQNVHTVPVSRQTNLYTEKLFEKAGDDRARYARPERFIAHWLDNDFVDLAKIAPLATDMSRFYSLKMVRETNDYLYRRVFNAVAKLIAEVPDKERRKEMSKRLFEECWESVGMCAEGHLTRLCNVFVGFDDAFAPSVPVAELLQQKIGAISVMEISVEEKLRLAVEVFSELKVSEAEQVPWREALESM